MLLRRQHRACKAPCMSCAHAKQPVAVTTELACIVRMQLRSGHCLVELGSHFHGGGGLRLEPDDPQLTKVSHVDGCPEIMSVRCWGKTLGWLWGCAEQSEDELEISLRDIRVPDALHSQFIIKIRGSTPQQASTRHCNAELWETIKVGSPR